jgi:hypothetical protein
MYLWYVFVVVCFQEQLKSHNCREENFYFFENKKKVHFCKAKVSYNLLEF